MKRQPPRYWWDFTQDWKVGVYSQEQDGPLAVFNTGNRELDLELADKLIKDLEEGRVDPRRIDI